MPRFPVKTILPALLLSLAGSVMAQQAPPAHVAAGVQRWALWVYHPFRPRVFSLCKDAHLKDSFLRDARPDPADPFKARVLGEAAQIEWSGGLLSQPGVSGPSGTAPRLQYRSASEPGWRLLTDACFTLFVDGKPVVSGALTHPFAAPFLDFPVLIVNRMDPDAPLSLTLLPRSGAGLQDPVPAGWGVLSGTASSVGDVRSR
ncbi:MAG: hypothetical protein EOO28_18405 [Comamonadaceae bacterium]|nr:MAG: hypothetical protein EOO28_18405 [Comamonadaceae bacterium]